MNDLRLLKGELGENTLVGDAKVVVATLVELAPHAVEVAHPRQADIDQPVEELVHPSAAQCHTHANRRTHASTDLKASDRLLGQAINRRLASDLGNRVAYQLVVALVFFVLADSCADHNLLEPRHLVHIAQG